METTKIYYLHLKVKLGYEVKVLENIRTVARNISELNLDNLIRIVKPDGKNFKPVKINRIGTISTVTVELWSHTQVFEASATTKDLDKLNQDESLKNSLVKKYKVGKKYSSIKFFGNDKPPVQTGETRIKPTDRRIKKEGDGINSTPKEKA